PLAHNNLGIALKDKGDLDGAIACYRQALRLDPQFALAHTNLGAALKDKGDLNGAIACHRRALRLDPRFARAHINLGAALWAQGNRDVAIAYYRQALRLDPKDARTHNFLAWLLAVGPDGLRDGKRAVEHATRACELTAWKDAIFIDTLAAA